MGDGPLVTPGPGWCPAALHLIYEWTERMLEPSAGAEAVSPGGGERARWELA